MVDSISTLFDNAYLRTLEETNRKPDILRWAGNRKYTVMNDLITAIRKTAALKNLAVLITVQAVTRMRPGAGAVLLPSVNSKEWDAGITTRMVIFQDWAVLPKGRNDGNGEVRRARHISVTRSGGLVAGDEREPGNVVTFEISGGIMKESEVEHSHSAHTPIASEGRPLKRTFSQVADSEDEGLGSDDDYGWAEDDQVRYADFVIRVKEKVNSRPTADARDKPKHAPCYTVLGPKYAACETRA